MGLLDKSTSEFTPPQRAAQALREIARDTATRIASNYLNGYQLLWYSDTDPQLILNELGPDASEMFYLTNASMGLVDPAMLKSVPDGYTYVINSDKTITLTYVRPLDAPADTTAGSNGNDSE